MPRRPPRSYHIWTTREEAWLDKLYHLGCSDPEIRTNMSDRMTLRAIVRKRIRLGLYRAKGGQRNMERNATGQFTGLATALALLLAASPALAAPPAGADPAMAPFFESLQSKQGFGSCCGSADCRPVASRSPANSPSGHWEVYIDSATFGKTAPNTWVQVPADIVDDDQTTLPRPPQAIACWYPYAGGYLALSHLRCFRTPQVQD